MALGTIELVAPIGLGMTAFIFFYLALGNKNKAPQWFQLFFATANIFLLAGVLIMKDAATTYGFTGIAGSLFALFNVLMWIYIVLVALIFFNLIKTLAFIIYETSKTRLSRR
jgi:hypothetical protein